MAGRGVMDNEGAGPGGTGVDAPKPGSEAPGASGDDMDGRGVMDSGGAARGGRGVGARKDGSGAPGASGEGMDGRGVMEGSDCACPAASWSREGAVPTAGGRGVRPREPSAAVEPAWAGTLGTEAEDGTACADKAAAGVRGAGARKDGGVAPEGPGRCAAGRGVREGRGVVGPAVRG